MADIFYFSVIAFFAGILGLILGGPFRLLVVENEAIQSPIVRMIFGFVFFPPVVGAIGLILYWLFVDNPEFRAEDLGAVVGLATGMTYSFVQAGKRCG